jgi:hypothetical protein
VAGGIDGPRDITRRGGYPSRGLRNDPGRARPQPVRPDLAPVVPPQLPAGPGDAAGAAAALSSRAVARGVVEALLQTTPLAAAVPPFLGWYPTVSTFDVHGSTTVVAGTTARLVQFKVPVQKRAIWSWWGHSVLDQDAWGALTWFLKWNDGTLPYCGRWTTEAAGIDWPHMRPLYLCAGPGDIVAIDAANGGLTNFAACAAIKGFLVPSAEAM